MKGKVQVYWGQVTMHREGLGTFAVFLICMPGTPVTV